MSAIPLRTGRLAEEVFYPSEDGQPMAETESHLFLMLKLIEMLRRHFHPGKDIHVGGNSFFYYEKGNPEARRSPDVMVIKGVPQLPMLDSFKTWEHNAVPCVVIELTSKSTADEDQGPKKELYERIGVREYFLFDPLNDYLPRPLVGYRLVKVAENGNGNGDPLSTEVHQHYEELLPDAEGGILSAELGLRLVPRGADLDLIDPVTKKPLPTPMDLQRANAELRHELEAIERQVGDEKKRADEEKRRADEERQRRELVEQQLAELHKLLTSQPRPSEGSQT